MLSPLPSSAWCSLPCFTTLHNIMTMASNLGRGVFNLRRLTPKTEVKATTPRELLFADDCALYSNAEAEIQECVSNFSRACDNFGFTITTNKTAVMHQPAPRKMHHEPHICVNDELPIISPTLEAPSREKPTLKWESITDFSKPTLHLEDSGIKFGSDEESAKTPSRRCT